MAICSIKLPGDPPTQSGYHWAPFPASSPLIFWPHPPARKRTIGWYSWLFI